jgi:N-acylneuraminate cytidylyltransferase
MKPLAIIPARGGSKRIFKKNIKKIDGVPALRIQIIKLLKMSIFEDVIVSTDDDEIAFIAEESGATVVLRKKQELSNDFTPSEDVVRDFLIQKQLKNSLQPVFCIYPLALLLDENKIRQAIKIHTEFSSSFVIAAGVVEPSPLRHTFTVNSESINVLFPENNAKRSQDLEITYFDAGMFYLASGKIWLDQNKYWYNNNCKLVIISKEDAIDVDTLEDFTILEKRFLQKYAKNS